MHFEFSDDPFPEEKFKTIRSTISIVVVIGILDVRTLLKCSGISAVLLMPVFRHWKGFRGLPRHPCVGVEAGGRCAAMSGAAARLLHESLS